MKAIMSKKLREILTNPERRKKFLRDMAVKEKAMDDYRQFNGEIMEVTGYEPTGIGENMNNDNKLMKELEEAVEKLKGQIDMMKNHNKKHIEKPKDNYTRAEFAENSVSLKIKIETHLFAIIKKGETTYPEATMALSMVLTDMLIRAKDSGQFDEEDLKRLIRIPYDLLNDFDNVYNEMMNFNCEAH